MKLKLLICLCLITIVNIGIANAQRARIVTEALTPHRLEELEFTTNSISTGLDVVGNETYVYLSAMNIGNNQEITSAEFEILSKPIGSAALLEEVNNPLWTQFKPDVKGPYVIQLTITTASGTHDTTKTIYAADYVGVGNFDGLSAVYPNCMSCHENHDNFVEIFDRWKESGHATRFKRTLTTGTTPINQSILRPFTTGWNPEANNNGFDDVAERLGWELGSANPQKWDSLKNHFTELAQFATIGCEACHGPGSEHTMSGQLTEEIDITLESGVCGSCHDHLPRNAEYTQWENSLHSEALWNNSFAQGSSSQNNNLQNCIRCHDAQGYVNFAKGNTTNTTGWTSANHVNITCATCHDPHGNENASQLRFSPTSADTLANGFAYSGYGSGMLCMSCHKARKDNVTGVMENINMRWGPHHSVQTDNLLGQNAAEFGKPYRNSPHKFAVGNSCVGCHMSETPDSANALATGGHSFKLYNEATGYYNTTACEPCHGTGKITSWDSFTAKGDHDGDGTFESIPQEIEGLISLLRLALPPANVDSIDFNQVTTLEQKKAYFNYQLISYDGSKGMHNSTFAIDVLQQSIAAIGGPVLAVEGEEGTLPEKFSLFQNYPNPFNPSTTIKYNIPFESSIRISIFNITGELIAELVNDVKASGSYEVKFDLSSGGRNLASGIYFYTIEAKPLDGNPSFRETKKMVLMK